MRRNHSARVPVQYSFQQLVLAVLSVTVAVAVGALLVMYPSMALLGLGATAGVWLLATGARRVRLTRRPARRYLVVRVPFTDLEVEV